MSRISLGMLARTPGLIIRLVFSALKFKRGVKKSAKKLRNSMIKGGMSRDRANELAYRYEKGLSIRRLIKSDMGDSGLPSIFPFNPIFDTLSINHSQK